MSEAILDVQTCHHLEQSALAAILDDQTQPTSDCSYMKDTKLDQQKDLLAEVQTVLRIMRNYKMPIILSH